MPGFEIFGHEERKELNDVLQTGVLMRYGFDGMRGGHWKAKELEAAISERLQVNYTQLTSSGTAALTAGLAALGIGEGDEVIMPTFTFVATFEAIISVGAKPVLVDIDDTLGLDPKAVERAITPHTKAIMVLHMCGSMADLDALLALAQKHHLHLVEDACQAWGGTYHGKPLGSIGVIGAFSFDYVKTITCGEGGAVVTNDKTIYQLVDQYTDHGHDHIGSDRGAEQHPFMGYNFRISELHAAVGLAQIRKTDHIISLQRRNKKILKDAIAQVAGITFRRLPDEAGDSAGFLSFFLPTASQATALEAEFKKNGVDSFWNYYNNNWHYVRSWQHLKQAKSMYKLSPSLSAHLEKLKEADFSASDALMSRNISCLIKLSWSEEETYARADRMVKSIKAVH